MAKVSKYSMSCGCVGVCTCGAQGIIINPGQGGARGAQGTQGISGSFAGQGVQGTQGSLGVQGTTGSGAQGAQGRLGAQGTVGAGTQGTAGAQGTLGTQGNLGTQGITGAGTQGTIGSQGIQGVQGGGVSLQDVEDLIANSALTTSDDLSEGTTNKYFTVARVSYEHIQDVVSDSWVIVHNLGFKPNVTVIDSAGTIYEGEIAYTNTNSLTVSFSAAFSGKAFLS